MGDSPSGALFPLPSSLFPDDVLDLLTSLVDKSVVMYEDRDGNARYRLLETARQYASDRLVESGESDTIRDRHRDYFVAFADEAAPKLSGAPGRRLACLLSERQ
jgi:predicted ATPase